MNLLKKVKHAIMHDPVNRGVKQVAKVGKSVAKGYVTGLADTLRHPTLKGVGKLAVRTGLDFVSGGSTELVFTAYDVRRAQQRNQRAKTHYRAIARSALQSSRGVENNIYNLLHPNMDRAYIPISPVHDTLSNPTQSPYNGFGELLQSQGPEGRQLTQDLNQPAPADKGTSGGPGVGLSVWAVASIAFIGFLAFKGSRS